MNTPAHLIFGATLFGKAQDNRQTTAAILGAMAPDLSLYLMAGVSLYILGISPAHVFNEMYFSPLWQKVFAIDNSFFLWGGLFGVAIWRKWPLLYAFSGAALLHIALDFPLHHDDGRAHFWPLSDWVFESPVSYWDSNHFAGFVIPIETLFVIFCFVILMRRYRSWAWRAVFATLLGAQLYTIAGWILYF